MDAPTPESSPVPRAAVAAGALAMAVFFGAIGIAQLFAPATPDMPWWVASAIRVFVGLMFGSMAALFLWGFVAAVRGPREPPLPLPLLTRCAACGEPILPTTSRCPGCGRAPGQVGRHWRETPREGVGGMLLAGGIGGALVGLAVLLVGMAVSGEERPLVALAYAGLGLLLGLVGGAMLYGGLLVLRDAYRDRGRRSFTLAHQEGGVTITATCEITRGGFALSGATTTSRALDDAPEPPPLDAPPSAPLRALVRTLAVLHARGEASLSRVDTLDWEVGARGELTRHTGADVLPIVRPPLVDVPVDPRDRVLFALAEGVTARSLACAFSGDPDLRNAFEAYAARLSADEADPRTTRILVAVLAGSAAPAPYRQPG